MWSKLGWAELAVALSAAGDTTQAVEQYRRVIELDPKNLTAYFNCATLLEKLGRLDDAIKTIETALAVEPDNTLISEILARKHKAQRQQPPTVSTPKPTGSEP